MFMEVAGLLSELSRPIRSWAAPSLRCHCGAQHQAAAAASAMRSQQHLPRVKPPCCKSWQLQTRLWYGILKIFHSSFVIVPYKIPSLSRSKWHTAGAELKEKRSDARGQHEKGNVDVLKWTTFHLQLSWYQNSSAKSTCQSLKGHRAPCYAPAQVT